jgi:general stress protein 26
MTNDRIDRVWDIIEEVPVCMVATQGARGLRARPMHALADREADCIWFITDTRGAKDEEIAATPQVCLCFVDVGDNTYLSVTGRADMMRDAALAADLWSTEAQAWWPQGPADPNVRVLRVVPEEAEYWDSRGNSVLVALKLAAARATGTPADLGENAKVRLR